MSEQRYNTRASSPRFIPGEILAGGRRDAPERLLGHGACTYAEDAPFGTVWGDYYTAKSNSSRASARTCHASAGAAWDSGKVKLCVCEPGYTDIDCSRRMCPKGNDVLDERLNLVTALKYQVQNVALIAAGETGDGITYNPPARSATAASATAPTAAEQRQLGPGLLLDFLNKSFALTFTSKMNQSYTTKPLVLNETNVFNISKAFSGDVRKALYLLEVETDECLDGCTPKLENPSRSSRTRANITGGVIGGNTQKMGTAPFLQYKGNVTSMPDIFSFVKEQVTADYNASAAAAASGFAARNSSSRGASAMIAQQTASSATKRVRCRTKAPPLDAPNAAAQRPAAAERRRERVEDRGDARAVGLRAPGLAAPVQRRDRGDGVAAGARRRRSRPLRQADAAATSSPRNQS
ncbi:hypothetical protein JL722_374 [Aureococcus anophagefferens]|nr:hypothetical protein JL722_374 [Aureococcus anophagefferens]